MKNWILLAIAIGFGMAVYEQSKPKPNVIIVAVGVLLFMLGVMKFSSKVPSKNKQNDGDDISKRG